MTSSAANLPHVVIACGGTGGHVFPGLAVATQLLDRGVSITLMVSTKEVDQLAVKGAEGMEVVTLPAVGLTSGRALAFLKGFTQSYRAARICFRRRAPQAALAMGGFTAAPPILAAKSFRARTFLHESNAIPGRANRWLSWLVDRVFVGFPCARERLHCREAVITGTPVRPRFQPRDPAICRRELGLNPNRPVVVVMGGSQGSTGINELVIRSLDRLAEAGPEWQWLHLAGSSGMEKVKQAYAAHNLNARVYPFFAEMELVMGAATAAVSRAGASSMAELAAMRLPAVLLPFPAATDNHQYYNARAFEETGAAKLLSQTTARPQDLAQRLGELMSQETTRQAMKTALSRWHRPEAAGQIAEAILGAAGLGFESSHSIHPTKEGAPPDSSSTACSAGPAWRNSVDEGRGSDQSGRSERMIA